MRDPAVTQDAPTVDRAERHRAPNSERTGSRVLAPQVGCLPTGTSSEEAAMKDAPAEPTGTTTGPAELPTNPPNGRTAGVDWAKDDHVVAVVDSTGTAIDRFTVPHTDTGLAELTRRLALAGCAEVAIERPDGPVVAELLEAGLTVVVISPNQLKNLRSRYGSAGKQGRPVRRLRAGRHAAHRPGPVAAAGPGQPRHGDPARDLPGSQGPGRAPGGAGQPTARAPADRLARRGRTVRRPGQPDQPALPAPVRHPRQAGLALAQAAGGLAGLGRLLRPGRPRGAARPADRRPPRPDRFRRCHPSPHHPGAAGGADQHGRADQGPGRADR